MTTKQKHKISFCTTCMGRLHHLQQTLLKNIEDNITYGNVEFVVLNYNSNDGLDQWVQQNLNTYIEQDIVVYIKTSEPKYWHASHAKNITAKYASGDIICNVDSDNLIGVGYADYINDYFTANTNNQVFLTGRTEEAEADSVGRVCTRKQDFFKVNGYNENIKGYGYEDVDLYVRLTKTGIKEEYIDPKFLNTIPHENVDRLQNTNMSDELAFILSREEEYQSKALVMRKDGGFEQVLIVPEKKEKKDIEVAIDDSKTVTGTWHEEKNKIVLKKAEQTIEIRKESTQGNDIYVYNGEEYLKTLYSEKSILFFLYTVLINQRVSRELKKIAQPNHEIGKAKVSINFDMIEV